MISKFNKFILLAMTSLVLIFSNSQSAKELLIYADFISYDKDENLIAKGNAKIINKNEIISSNLIIINKKDSKIILPTEFKYKDEKNNYYYGSSGFFSKNMKKSEINNVKLLLNDGSRIVGKKVIKNNNIEIITKGSYSPCSSKINIKDFICPIWQIDGEKILHDRNTLFLYQKHAKIKLANVPVFYLPYLVTPSPLRKERKSGFLTPSISLNFFNAKTTQSISLPYYFNLALDKELTFTPVINYGGGVNSSQRFVFDYNQLNTGGKLKFKVDMDTNIEKENSDKWINDALFVTNYNNNINEKFNININSALQTSRTYLRITDPNNTLSYNSSLTSSLNLNGYDLKNYNDQLNINISTYQVVQKNEDNKKIPTILPYVKYGYQKSINDSLNYRNTYEFYNIFRENGTVDHAQKQQKLSLNSIMNKNKYLFKSKINFKAQLFNQFFITENKKVENINYTGSNYRLFPMAGFVIQTPILNQINNIVINPKVGFYSSLNKKNNLKISNEDSTNNYHKISNQLDLNRFSGTDKLDNSTRAFYNINIKRNNIKLDMFQNYEFTPNSDYNKDIGNLSHLGDFLLEANYNNNKSVYNYFLRYNPNIEKIFEQSFSISNNNILGTMNLNYLDEKKETSGILDGGNENVKFDFKTKKIKEYSNLKLNAKYDLLNDTYSEYSLGYSYFDECFGINLDFHRKFYEDTELRPIDNLTLMFSFKYLGAYQSSNLAVSENDKQDIEWVSRDINNESFN